MKTHHDIHTIDRAANKISHLRIYEDMGENTVRRLEIGTLVRKVNSRQAVTVSPAGLEVPPTRAQVGVGG